MISLVDEAKALLDKIPDSRRFTWNFRRRNLMEKIVEEDGLDKFLSWPVVREALYAGYTSISKVDESFLSNDVLNLAADPRIGKPSKLSQNGHSGTMLRQFRVANMIDNALRPLNSIDNLIEIGGGYGAFAYAMHKLGFSGNHYVYDFPELHLIRDWYLNHFGIKTISIVSGESPIGVDIDVLVAINSICEMPIKHRENVLRAYPADNYVFFITKFYDGVNNYDWFYNSFYGLTGATFREIPGTIDTQALFVGGVDDN